MASSPVARTKVFISYSQKDSEFLQRLQVHLAPDVRNKRVDPWDDSRILPGARRQQEIGRAIQAAKVAVLLVSADFLASDFITQHELTPLLAAAVSEGVTILPVLLKPCGYKSSPLAELQFVNDPAITVVQMDEAQREATWVRVAELISEALHTPLSPFPSRQPDQQASQQSATTSTPIAERYRQALLADPAMTKLQVLSMSAPLPISQIYVRLQLYEGMRQKYAFASRQQKTNDPLTLMQQQGRLLEKRVRMAMDPAEALRKYNQCIILGDPGAGKTTLLKYLAIQAANGQLAEIPPVPIYIRLNAFASSGESDLLTFAASSWQKAYAIRQADAYGYIQEQIEAGNALLLLDALDEAAIGDTVELAETSYRRVVDEITRLGHRCPWMVVTARRAGYQQRAKLHAFTELELLDFRPQEIEKFIENWFLHHPLPERRGYAPYLVQELKNNPRIQTLAANPLLLTLITLAYEDEMELPERRSTLYKKCVETLLSRWDSSRSIQRRRGFRLEHQQQLLREIAWYAHLQRLRYFGQEQIIPVIVSFLQKLGIDASQAHNVLQAISGDNGLLREQADGVYGFFHLTLQEYFAAQQVKDVTVLLAHLHDPWWEEVVLLYAGATDDASPLLAYLLATHAQKELPEDIFATKLLLAGRCLATHPIIHLASLREIIPERLFKLLQQTNYALIRQQCANTLAELGRAYLERDVNQRLLTILMNAKGNVAVRISIATALGEYGAREVAPDLLEYLVQAESLLDAELRNAIEEAIAKLTDRTLLPRLLELVADSTTEPLVAIAVAYFIGRAGDAATAAQLLPLLTDTAINDYVRMALADTVCLLGDATTISALMAFIADPIRETELAIGVLLTLSFRGYRAVAGELLDLLSQRRLSADVRMEIASTLGVLGDATTAHGLLPLVSDSSLDIQLRLACAGALTQCALRTQPSVALALLANAETDENVRIMIAYIIADSGARKLLAAVRSILLQEQDEQVRDALIIAAAVLGDELLAAKLPALLLHGSVPGHLYRKVADVMVQAMQASAIIATLTNAKIDVQIRVTLAQALAAADKSVLVPDLLRVLAEPVVAQEVRISVAEAIGMLGETKATVEALLQQWRFYELRDPLYTSALVDAIYQALWSVSRRVGVLIVRKGAEYEVLEQ